MTTQAFRHTKLTLRIQERYGRPFLPLLVEKVRTQGPNATARELGVSKATVGYWLLKGGVRMQRVVLLDGERGKASRRKRRLPRCSIMARSGG